MSYSSYCYFMAVQAAEKKFVIPFKTPKPKKVTVLGKEGDGGTGTLEVETFGMLKTGERAMIEDAGLWEYDEIDSRTSKLAKSIYDREKAAGKATKLTDIDLAIRRLQNNDYSENEVKAASASIALGAALEKAVTSDFTDVVEIVTPLLQEFESFLELMKVYPAPTAQKDLEILELYMDEVKALSRELAKEDDRRYYTYAQVMAWFRLGLEGITIDELRDELGNGLIFRLGLFGIYENRGMDYVEEERFPGDKKKDAGAIEERSEDEILKP